MAAFKVARQRVDLEWVALLVGLLSFAVIFTRPWELIAGLLSTGSFDSLRLAFREACGELIVVAARGAILFWGVFMGRLLGTGFFAPPTRLKVPFISMPVAVLVAALFASWSFRIVDPGETTAQAIHDEESIALPDGVKRALETRFERDEGGVFEQIRCDAAMIGEWVRQYRHPREAEQFRQYLEVVCREAAVDAVFPVQVRPGVFKFDLSLWEAEAAGPLCSYLRELAGEMEAEATPLRGKTSMLEADELARQLASKGAILTGDDARAEDWAGAIRKVNGKTCSTSTVGETSFWKTHGHKRGKAGPRDMRVVSLTAKIEAMMSAGEGQEVLNRLVDETEEKAVRDVLGSALPDKDKARVVQQLRDGEITATAARMLLSQVASQLGEREPSPLEPDAPGRPRRVRHHKRL